MSTAPRPGWYRDPAGTSAYRWWDGSDWTGKLSPSAQAPPPAMARETGGGLHESDDPDEFDPLRSDPLDPRTPRRTTWQRVVALVVIVALVAGTGIGVAALWWGSVDRPSPSGAPAAASPGPGGQFEERSRQATISGAGLTLPDEPYLVHADPVPLPKVFDALFLAEAVVHDNYAGMADWSAMVCFASVSPTLTESADLSTAAAAAVQELATRLYGSAPRVKDLRIDDQAVDGHPGVLVSATVHYDIARLPSTYDVVEAWFVKLDDGTVVAAVTSVPDDAPAAVRDQARRSLETLTVS